MIGRDCDGRPIHIGDEVVWIEDSREPKERRRVLGPAGPGLVPPDSFERGYMRVSATNAHSGFHSRFGMNLRLTVDPDLVVDEGL